MNRHKREEEEIQRRALAIVQSRRAVVQPLQRQTTRVSPMSGRRIRSFRSSVAELELLMMEGDISPDGYVYSKWGIPQIPKE